MNRVRDYLLWTGGFAASASPEVLSENKIQVIIDLTFEKERDCFFGNKVITYPEEMIIHRIPLKDFSGNSPENLELAISKVSESIEEGKRTLVSCAAGWSRSRAIATAGIAFHTGKKWDECSYLLAENLSKSIVLPLLIEVRLILGRMS